VQYCDNNCQKYVSLWEANNHSKSPPPRALARSFVGFIARSVRSGCDSPSVCLLFARAVVTCTGLFESASEGGPLRGLIHTARMIGCQTVGGGSEATCGERSRGD